MQATHVDQVEPGIAPMPTVIDHECEPPRVTNLLSVFPGRATLWPRLAELARAAVLAKLSPSADTLGLLPIGPNGSANRVEG
jgi:hypothetical protein